MVKERAFDLAILRTYGASNFQLIQIVLYEGLCIAFLAFFIGFIFIKTLLNILFIFMQSNYPQNILQELPFLDILQIGCLILVMIMISIAFAIYPILKMNISRILSHEK